MVASVCYMEQTVSNPSSFCILDKFWVQTLGLLLGSSVLTDVKLSLGL